MKRFLWLLLGAVLIVLGLGPWVEGQVAWRLLTRHLQPVSEQFRSHGLDASLDLASYQDGWRDSRAHYRLRVNLPQDKQHPLCFDLSARVQHGWQQMLRGRWFELTLRPGTTSRCSGLKQIQGAEGARFWSQWLKGVTLTGHVAWNRNIVLGLQRAAIHRSAKSGPQFGALRGQVAFGAGGKTLSYHLHWDGLQLSRPSALRSAALNQSALAGIGAVSIDGHQSRYLEQLHTGHFAAEVDGIDYFTAIHGQIARLQGAQLQLQVTTQAEQGQLNSDVHLQFGGLKLNTVDFGQLLLEAHLTGIAAQPWDRFNAHILALRNHASASASPPEDILQELTDPDIALAQKGLSQARLTLTEGHYRLGDARISMTGQLASPTLGQLKPAQIKASPERLLKTLRAHLDIAMDRAFTQVLAARSARVLGNQSSLKPDQVKALQSQFAQRFNAWLQSMQTRGFIEQDQQAGKWRLRLTFDGSHLKVNGNPWNLPKGR